MLGISHHDAVKVLCEAQTDLVLVVLRQRADGIATSPTVNILTLNSYPCNAGPVYVSVTSRSSVKTAEQIKLVFGTEASFFYVIRKFGYL